MLKYRYMIELLSAQAALMSAIPFLDPVEIIKWAGVVSVAAVVFAESGLLIGFFLPGDSLLFTAGFLTQTGFLKIDINVLVLILFVAAVAGDSVGYTFGRRVGRRLYERPNSRWFKQEHVQKAEAFYEQYGGKTIILARFIPFVRTFAPVIAGTAKMKYKTFVSYNLIGGLLWAGGVTYLGYFLGDVLTRMGLDIDQVLLPIIIIIILASVMPPVIHILKDKKRREVLWAGTKIQVRKLLRRK
jgi:membrane-associated protein